MIAHGAALGLLLMSSSAQYSAELPAAAQEVTPAPGTGLEAPPSRAADPMPAPSPTPRRWYGMQVLGVDALAAMSLVVSASTPLGLVGLPAYVLAAPTVHVGHGDWLAAGVSVLLRVALPVLGAQLGASGCAPTRDGMDFSCVGPAAGGGLIGVGAASFVDAIFLSRAEEGAGARWALAAGGEVGTTDGFTRSPRPGLVLELALASPAHPFRLTTELSLSTASATTADGEARSRHLSLRWMPEALLLRSSAGVLYLGAVLGWRSMSNYSKLTRGGTTIEENDGPMMLETGLTGGGTVSLPAGWSVGLRLLYLHTNQDLAVDLGTRRVTMSSANSVVGQVTLGWGDGAREVERQ